jgi:hypothetical protein
VKLPAAHLDEIETACRNIRIITRATVSELEISPEGTAVTGVTAFSGTHRIAIAAGKVVLASGLENAPILMRAVGEPSDDREHRLPALGRFLHTHLLSLRGFFVPRSDSLSFRQWALPGDLGEEFAHGRDTFYGLQVAQAQRERKKMLNGVMFLSPVMGGGETDLS